MDKRTNWEVLNFGLPGASIYEADDFIIDDALEYGPQKAILCYDINSSLYSIMTRAQGGSRSDRSKNLARSSLVFRWLELLFFSGFQGSQPVLSLDNYDLLLQKSIHRLRDAGVEVVLVIGWAGLADFPNLYSKQRYEQFRERSRLVAKKMEVTSVETASIFKESESDLIFTGMEQMHFSKKGHERFATTLIKVLALQEKQ